MSLDLDTIFTPSTSFLNAVGEPIGNKMSVSTDSYSSIPLLKKNKVNLEKYVERNAIKLVDSIFLNVEIFSKVSASSEYEFYDEYRIFDLLFEIIFNSYIHSPVTDGFHLKSFYGKRLGLGLYDGGSFYKQDWVKKSIESKTNILPNVFPSNFNITGSGRNCGMNVLYSYADFLEVDTKTGVLYAVIADKFLTLAD